MPWSQQVICHFPDAFDLVRLMGGACDPVSVAGHFARSFRRGHKDQPLLSFFRAKAMVKLVHNKFPDVGARDDQ